MTRNETLLVVDDKPDNLLVLQTVLSNHFSGCNILTASSAEEGLALAAGNPVDCALIDVQMPGIDGVEMCRRLRANEAISRFPIILITSHRSTAQSRAHALEAGADDFLDRPIDNIELVARINVMLRVKRSEDELRDINARLESVVDERTQDLRESEERYRSIAETANDAIVAANSQGLIIVWNKAAERIFGYSEEEALNQPLSVLMPEHLREAYAVALKRYLETGESYALGRTTESVGCRKDGREFPLELSLASWTARGEPLFTAVIRDLTERKRAEDEIRSLNQQNKLILESAGEGVYGLDMRGNTTFVNPAAARMIGWQVEELIGQPQHDVLHHTRFDGTPYPREECPIYAAFKDGAVHHVDSEVFWRRDGSSFPVEYVSTPIREDEKLVGAVVVFRDITDRRRAEETARSAQEELLARREWEKELVETELDSVREELVRKTRLATLGQLTELLDEQDIPEGITMTRDLTAGVELSLDRKRLRRCVINLVTNACQVMQDTKGVGGRLIVETAVRDDRLTIRVRDNGAGITPENMKKIFEPLHTTKGFGVGLGLPIVRLIAEQHGGGIDIESQPGRGTEATLWLPLPEQEDQ